MDLTELKTLAAKHFGIDAEKVSDAQVAAIKAIHDDLVAQELPGADEKAAHEAAIAKMEENIATEKAAKIEAERQLAEYKTKPPIDPDADAAVLGRIKSLPDITTAVLDESEGEPDVRAFRRQWDILHTLSTVKGNFGPHGHMPAVKLDYWQKLKSKYPMLTEVIQKAIDTGTSTGGAEWAPTLYSTDLQQSVYDETTVARQFPRTVSPRGTWVLPFSPTGGSVYVAGESSTTSAAEFTETDLVSRAPTITAIKLMCRVAWSDEFEEDSIVAAAGLFQEHTTRLLAEAIDSAIMNGDTTSTHMDTALGYTSTSPEMAFNGLRDIAMNGMSSSTDLDTALSGDKVLAMIDAGTARFIKDPTTLLLFTSPKTRSKWFGMVDNATNKNAVYMRSTPMGDDLVRMGAFMDFFGTPVIPTATISTTLAATGLGTSTSTYTIIVWCNKNCFLLTDRKEIGSVLVDQPLQGLKNVLTSWRGSFNGIQGLTSSTTYAGVGYNLTS